jgi:predicted dehydrogenase
MTNIDIAVIGIGHLGSEHARIYANSKRVNLTAVCDINKDRLKSITDNFKARTYLDYKKLLSKERIDAVSICVPTELHFKIAKDCLLGNIHVLVEKPITSTIKEANKLLDLAKKKKLVFQVGHVERFNSAFQVISQIAKKPLFIECHRLSPFPSRSLDIGVVLDLMIHDIDIILGLVRSKPKNIDAVGVNVLTDYEDIANVRINFRNGCVCNLTASRVSDETMRKIRIFLKDTYISLDYVNQEALIYRKKRGKITCQPILIEKEEPLVKELEDFISCIIYKKRPIVSGQEGRDALELATKIKNKIWLR